MCKCLFCYKELNDDQKAYHPNCAKKFFGTKTLPAIEYGRAELDGLASKIIQSQTALTGVQPKLSLNLVKHRDSSKLTIVELWGNYIFKPQTEEYPQLPETEDLTMHLADIAHIHTVPHCLIRMADNSIGYITKRIDRTPEGKKIDMEDMCQLTEHPTEYKYRSSYEQVAKAIATYSSIPRLDMANYMQLLIFCFLTGNNDMHLKNFSLYSPIGKPILTPAYDLLNVTIINPKDKEETALTLNGKKSRLRLSDFITAGRTMGIAENTIMQTIAQFRKIMPKWEDMIRRSFLTTERQDAYITLLHERMEKLQ